MQQDNEQKIIDYVNPLPLLNTLSSADVAEIEKDNVVGKVSFKNTVELIDDI